MAFRLTYRRQCRGLARRDELFASVLLVLLPRLQHEVEQAAGHPAVTH